MPNGNMMPPSLAPAMQGQGSAPPNALQRQAPPGASGGGGFSAEQHVNNNLQQANAQHKQLQAADKRIQSARKELDSLGKLGDTITTEDVIKGAGTLVGSGFSPMALAQMLSSMPTTGGQALQAWVAQQEQQVRAMEMQLRQKLVSSSIHRGVTAMTSLHIDHIKDKMGMPPPPQGGGGIGVPSAMAGSSTPLGPQGPEESGDEEG